MNSRLRLHAQVVPVAAFALFVLGSFSPAVAVPVPGGTLNPLTIPKYVIPLVIPPVMPTSVGSPTPAADYDIAVRQFKQQILPGGIWGGTFPPTTVWSYGRASDPLPDSTLITGGGPGIAPATNSSFNYPALTVEATANVATKVRWINDLKDPTSGAFLPHLFKVDQTLHWANPPNANCLMMPANRTDCETAVAAPYTGPVPLVTHLHGAHVQPHSDGYPEAWWLPAANNIPVGYAQRGSHFGQADALNTVPGSAYFNYANTQAATTLWYHDHTLGMTRLNVYAGPAGFWLIRGGANGDGFVDNFATPAANDGVLPGPAPTIAGGDPNFNVAVRNAIREIPIVIQDRSFDWADATGAVLPNSTGATEARLFYPANRTFFDAFTGPFIGNSGYPNGPYAAGPPPTGPSDMSGIWNPEAFFNTIVVNGTTWPKFDVAPARYRLRLLDGCNSRTLNLALFQVTSLGADGIAGTADDTLGAEIPFYQIGAEQGFLPKVVKILTGSTTTLPGNGTVPAADVPAPPAGQALLMMPAERADVIVDFTGLANGTRIRMINTAPDAPFGGFPVVAPDPLTTGQVMDFIVNVGNSVAADANTTAPQNLVLPAELPLGAAANTRQVSLNEMSSDQVCVEISAIDGSVLRTIFSTVAGDPNFLTNCTAAVHPPTMGGIVTPMGPRQAQLGVLTTVGANLVALPRRWSDPITETPALNSTEVWEIFNTTADAHPIHLHLVGFQVVNRQLLDPAALLAGNLVLSGAPTAPNPNEKGFKDTVVAYPGQVTRIKAKFDIPGLYVWHCHIVEHEDNEMMRPMLVKKPITDLLWRNSVTGDNAVWNMTGTAMSGSAFLTPLNDPNWKIVGAADFDADGKPDLIWRNSVTGDNAFWYMNGATRTGSAFFQPLNDPNWKIVGAADFDADGKPDLVWRNSVTGNNAVWYMNGTTMTGSAFITPLADTNWNIVGVADSNGDGKPDLIWRNSVTGDNAVWYMNGTAMAGSAFLPPLADPNWKIVGFGDYNADSKPDLIWRNSVTGDNAVWYMNGTTMTGSAFLPSLADPNWSLAGIQ